MKLLTKKAFAFILVFALIISLALTGCSSNNKDTSSNATEKTSSQPINLVFWTLWDGGDVQTAQSIFDEYNKLKEKDNVKITMQQQTWDQYYTKLKTAIMGGTGPDFAISHIGGNITSMQNDGILVPIDEMAKKYNVNIQFDKYSKSVLETAKFDGKYYSVPLDNLTRVLMYNKALLKDTGLLDKDGKLVLEKGLNGFTKTLDTIKQKNPNVAPLVISMKPAQMVLNWLTFYYQNGGGEFLNITSKKASFDDKKAVEALSVYKDIYTKYVPAKLTSPAEFEMFKAGKAALYLDGTWNISACAASLGKDFGVTVAPTLFSKDALVTTSHGFIIPVKKDRTDAQTKEVLEFIKWFADNNAKWCQAGHLPGYTPTLDTKEFKALPYHPDFMNCLKDALPLPVVKGTMLHTAPEVNNPVQKALFGEITPEEAVKNIKQGLDGLLPKLLE